MTAHRLILSLALASTPLLGCDDGGTTAMECDGGACADGDVVGEGGMGGIGAGGADGPGGMGGADGEGGAGGEGEGVGGMGGGDEEGGQLETDTGWTEARRFDGTLVAARAGTACVDGPAGVECVDLSTADSTPWPIGSELSSEVGLGVALSIGPDGAIHRIESVEGTAWLVSHDPTTGAERLRVDTGLAPERCRVSAGPGATAIASCANAVVLFDAMGAEVGRWGPDAVFLTTLGDSFYLKPTSGSVPYGDIERYDAAGQPLDFNATSTDGVFLNIDIVAIGDSALGLKSSQNRVTVLDPGGRRLGRVDGELESGAYTSTDVYQVAGADRLAVIDTEANGVQVVDAAGMAVYDDRELFVGGGRLTPHLAFDDRGWLWMYGGEGELDRLGRATGEIDWQLRALDADGVAQGEVRFPGAYVAEVRWSGGFVVIGLQEIDGDGRWVVALDPAAP